MLSLHPNRNKLLDYFPENMKVYEYNASNGKATNTTLSEVADWLFAMENGGFVFQCLYCCQEMNFRVVFWNHNWHLNRSHLLTKKHNNRLDDRMMIGLLFNSCKKFVLCSQSRFESGGLLDNMEGVGRQVNKILKNPGILNQIFCGDYKFYTFDRFNRKLKEFEYKDDIVKFMQLEVRPLFKFHCMLCDRQATSFTKVVNHLGSAHHKKEMDKSTKVALLAIKEFNVFLACRFDKLSSLMYLEHPNSKLKEIIIGGSGGILISGTYKNDIVGTSKEITITKFDPIMLPDNKIIKNGAVQVRIPFHTPLLNNAIHSPNSYENNVTIYEFSENIVEDRTADNLIYSVLSNGCKIWCSRCSTSMDSSEEFGDHLSSPIHKARVRSNEQIGFMCHTCKIFFIELKGDSLAHIHKSTENKKVIKTLESKISMITYNTPLNKCINEAYSSMLNNFSDVWMFSCLSCFDLSKKKLSLLSHHESNKHHSCNQVFVLCEFCNVIYINAGDMNEPSSFFKEHFETHLNPGIMFTRTIKMWYANLSTERSFPFDLEVTPVPRKVHVDLSIPNCTKILVSSSKYFCQLVHPGISQSEFHQAEQWTEASFAEYVSFFYMALKPTMFICLKCNGNKYINSEVAAEHCFDNCPRRNPLGKTYLKFCDICNELLMASQMLEIQNHFLSRTHIYKLLAAAGLSNVDINVNQETMNKCKLLFPTQNRLMNLINGKVEESKLLWSNKDKTMQKIESDCNELLLTAYPNVHVQFHGSQMSGLALKNNIFDICFDVGEDNFDKVKSIFQNSQFEYLTEDSGPTFHFTNHEEAYHCNMYLGLKWKTHHAKLVKMLIDYDERVHWVLVAVRHWAKETMLWRHGAISSPQIIWLVFFYLMQSDVRIIPHIASVFETCGSVENIGTKKDLTLTWDNTSAGPKKSSLDLLEGFFHYYSILDFSKYSLSPSKGTVCLRAEDDTSPWNLEDPFSKENIFKESSLESCRNFQALCYVTLNMDWRICL